MTSGLIISLIYLSNPILGAFHTQYDDYFHNLTTPSGPTGPNQSHFPTPVFETGDYWNGELGWVLDTYAKAPRNMVLLSAEIDWAAIRSLVSGDDVVDDVLTAAMEGDLGNDAMKDVIDLAMGELSILISCALFLLAAPLVVIVGLFFCCCRCCGRCGGKLSVNRARKQIGACSFIIAVFLLVLLLLNMFGATTTVLVGSRLDFAITTLEDSATLSLRDGQSYMSTTVTQLDQLAVNELNLTLTRMKSRLDASGSIVALPLMAYMLPSMRELLQGLATLQNATHDLDASLTSFEWNSDRLSNNGTLLQVTLVSVASNLTDLQAGCAAANFSNSVCSSLPTGDVVVTEYNFSASLDVASYRLLVNDIHTMHLNETQMQAELSYEDIPHLVSSSINASLEDIMEVIDDIDTAEVEDAIRDIKDPMDDLQETLQDYEADIAGYREEFQQYIDLWFQFFLGAASLVWSTILWAICGGCCGYVGRKVDTAPQKRSPLSHCGGRCLMCSVCLSFPIVALFSLLGAIFLLVFGNITLFCTALENESIFYEFVDYEGVLGTNLVADNVPFNGTENLTVLDVLTSCREGETLYTVFHLDSMFNVTSLVDMQQIRDDINVTSLQTVAQDAVSSVIIVDSVTLNTMATVRASWPASLNFSELIEEHTVALLAVQSNLTVLAAYLHDLAAAPAFSGTDYQARYNELANQLDNLTFNELINIEIALNDLAESVSNIPHTMDQLYTYLLTVKVEAEGLQQTLTNNGSDALIEGAGNLVDEVIQIGQSYIDYVEEKLRDDVGECSLVGDVYDAVVQSVCYQILNVMNCAWFSLLAMAALLVAQIVLATKLVKYFRIPHDASTYYEPPREPPRPTDQLNIGRQLEPCMSELRRTVLANEHLAFAGEKLCAPSVRPVKT